jgi:tRNA A-37 threonylcarbamoyl transferase component Bud32
MYNVGDTKGGLSGAKIYRDGDIVHKTAENTDSVAQWYKFARSSSLKTPNVLNVTAQTISLEFIDNNSRVDYDVVVRQLENNKNYIHKDIPDFSTYIDRVRSHGLDSKYLLIMDKHSQFYNKHKSFCHGDTSVDNILCKNNTIYYIDPIYLPNVYSSWLLDISKLLTSLKRYGNMETYKDIIGKYNDIKMELDILEMSHWIRMYKYHPSKDYVTNQIEQLYESIRN